MLKIYLRNIIQFPLKIILYLGNLYSRILYKIDPYGSEKYWEEMLIKKINNETFINYNQAQVTQSKDFHDKLRNIKFYTPNKIANFRARTNLTKEKSTIIWMEKYGSERKIFFDIGANIGNYSLCYTAMFNSKVYAFEPSFKNLDLLKKNILLNNFQSKIIIIPNALSSDFEECKFNQVNDEYAAATSTIVSNSANNKSYYKTVSLSIDALVSRNIISFPQLIKIDVDGNELKILENLQHNSLKKCESISIEVDKKNLKEIEQILNNKGFFLKDSSGPNQIWNRK